MKLLSLGLAALVAAAALPASAQMYRDHDRDHRHSMRACHMEYRHHHRMQVCRR